MAHDAAHPPRVRLATVADADAIGRIHVLSWQSTYRGLIRDATLDALDPSAKAATWRASLEQALPHVRIWIGELDGAPAGFATTGPTRDPDDDPASVMELATIYLVAAAQRRGLGRRLFEIAASDARARGFRELTLQVHEGNLPARRFYEAMGMSVEPGWRRMVELDGEQLPHLRYRLRLT